MTSENKALGKCTHHILLKYVNWNNFLEGTLAIDMKNLNQFFGPCFVNDYCDYGVSLVQINCVKSKR